MKKRIIKTIMYFSFLTLFLVPIINVNAENLVTSIEVSESSLNINVGASKSVTTTVLPADADDLTVTYSSSNEDVATVSSTGDIQGVSAGTAVITVTSNNVSTITKTINVTVVNPKSSDFNLKSLSIDGYSISPNFSASNKAYALTVPANVTKINVKAEANDNTATVSGTGSISLSASGTTSVKVTVTAEDGGKKIYEIKVTKEETNLDLKSLKVKGQTLNETFSADKTDYTLEVEYEIVTLSITAAASDSNAKVTVSGGTNLIVGENKVIVTVKDSYGNTKKYNIIVTRKEEEEDKDEKSNSTSSITSTDLVTTTNNDSGSKNHTLQYVLVTIGSILLLVIAGFGIYFYIKTEDPEKKKARLEKKLAKKNQKIKKEKIESALVEAEVEKLEDAIDDAEENTEDEIIEEDEEIIEDSDDEEYEEEQNDINDQDTIEFEAPSRPSRRMSRYTDEEDE